MRTCIGCRQRESAAHLIRWVAVQNQGGMDVIVDPTSTMSGRGAWLHRNADCLRLALRRRAFGPALKVPALVVDAAALGRQFEAVVDPEQGQT
ncbi:YlxR family protein [Williamsia sp. CHRR-6]|uniref:YlxR family protein n=1 Tax=Williamsia sp. CHRR-6 TaxID=2835871 RepID=UPI0027DE876C|nr:YlxR family protein [Williamsia sp. CHRR-6]